MDSKYGEASAGPSAIRNEASTGSIYASLAQTRGAIQSLGAGPSTRANKSWEAAVLHPLYSSSPDSVGDSPQSKTLHTAFLKTSADVRRRLKIFREESQSDGELLPREHHSNQDTIQQVDAPFDEKKRRAESSGGISVRQLLGKRQRFASLLREQSSHAMASVDLTQNILKSNASFPSLGSDVRHLPECLCIGALSPATTKETLSRRQEGLLIHSGDEARDLLKKVVEAFEQLAISQLGLEAFSEEHDTTSESSSTCTLALAAKIVVVDLEFSLQEIPKDDLRAWMPMVKCRVSYATDANSDPSRAAVRDGKLADLLLVDFSNISHSVFGFSEQGLTASAGPHEAARSVLAALRRLSASINTLKCLDNLSSERKLAEHVDLFSALEAASKTILDKQQDPKFGSNGLGLCRYHDIRPYIFSKYYETSYAPILSDAASPSTAQKGLPSTLDYSFEITISTSCLRVVRADSADLPALSSVEQGGHIEQMQFIAMLEPPLTMSTSTASRLLRACGVNCQGQGENKADAKCVQDFARLVHVLAKGGSRNWPRENKADNSEEPKESAVIVSRLPFTSTRQLVDATHILRHQACIDSLLRMIPLEQVKKVVEDEAGTSVHLFVDLSSRKEQNDSAIEAHVVFRLGLNGSWSVSASVVKQDEETKLDSSTEQKYSQQMGSSVSNVGVVIADISAWAQAVVVDGKSSNNQTQSSKNLKRRRSSGNVV